MIMKHRKTTIQPVMAILVTAAVCILSVTVSTVRAQGNEQSKRSATKSKGGRDPFGKYVPPKPRVKKSGLVLPPAIQERIAQYKAQKHAAMSARIAAPKPTTAFLLSELQVMGISRSPRGYAAIVEATPIKLAYVIYPGEKFYDGQLVAIEDNRLVFRRETVFSDGKRERTVEMKSLRQPSTVEMLSALKSAPANAGASEPDKTAEAKATNEKPY
jgi:hypothetical protein